MLFAATAQQETLRAKIRAFAGDAVKPQAGLMNKEHLLPEDAIRKLGEMSFCGFPNQRHSAAWAWI